MSDTAALIDGKPDVTLRLARRSNACRTLGPGLRAVLWVQGCPLRCHECVAEETLPFDGGFEVDTDQLAADLLALNGLEGLTLSGGEPSSQAEALVDLIDRIRTVRDLSVMCYSGFTLEHLRKNGSPAQNALLDRVDILVDGPYLPERHTDLIWRGSDNQRVLLLTDRHRDLEERLEERGHRIEFEVEHGTVHWMGIPPKGFRQEFEQRMDQFGIQLTQGAETNERFAQIHPCST